MAALEPAASPPKDTVAFAFLVVMILVAAIMFGVGASGIASGTVQDAVRWAGFGANAEIRAELARHGADIADIRASLDRTIGEAATLGARTEDLVRSDAAQSERLAKRVRFKVMRYAVDSRIEGGLAYGGGETERRGVFGNSGGAPWSSRAIRINSQKCGCWGERRCKDGPRPR